METKLRSLKGFFLLTSLFFLTSASLVALVNIGATSNPIQVSASSSSFLGRTTSVDLSGDDYPVTATPAITVLTHGVGGVASHWSNNNNYEFSFDNRSLIERLRDKNGANVFWAKMDYGGNNFEFYTINKLYQLDRYNTSNLLKVTQFISTKVKPTL